MKCRSIGTSGGRNITVDFFEKGDYMLNNQDRCDACGRFVPECSLFVDDSDDDNHRSICAKCVEEKIVSDFLPGQQVLWNWQPRGGYGAFSPVKAEIVRSTAKRVLIKVEQLRPVHRFVERWVKPESLRGKDA